MHMEKCCGPCCKVNLVATAVVSVKERKVTEGEGKERGGGRVVSASNWPRFALGTHHLRVCNQAKVFRLPFLALAIKCAFRFWLLLFAFVSIEQCTQTNTHNHTNTHTHTHTHIVHISNLK